jgi:hypothetical protein
MDPRWRGQGTYGMSMITIERAAGAENIRQQLIDIVVSRKNLSENFFMGVRQRFPRFYDLWRGTWTGRFHPHKNNVHIPLISAAVWADAACKAATSLNQWPIVTFMGYGPDDMRVARKREALISAQMKDDDLFMKQVQNFISADLYGVSVTQVGWERTEEERLLERIERLPLSGKIVKLIQRGTAVSFDGPVSEIVDLLDFFPQPGVQDLQRMRWMVRRLYLDLDEIRVLAKAGVFDPAELARLEREGGVGADTTDQSVMIRRFAMRTGMDDQSMKYMDRYARPIELLEYWGYVPSELAPDGIVKRVITVANRRYMLRNKPLPFAHGRWPFIAYSPNIDPHYFYAPGKAEIVEKLQIVGNRYINQTLDAADLIIDPMWFYDRSANLNTRGLYARPGRFIPVDGNPSEVVSPMMSNLSALTVGDSKIAQMREFVQMGTGIVEDTVGGFEGPSRETARGFLGRREAAGNRLMLESRLYEEMYLERLANMMVALDKQFLEPPVEVMILGDSANTDPVTGMALSVTREEISHLDMMPNYAARAMGATTALSKGMKQQNLIQLLTAMGTPMGQMIMSQINQLNFWRGIFRDFDITNVNELFMPNGGGLGPNNPLAMMAQNVGGAAGINGVPTSGQVVNGQPLPGMGGAPVQDLQNTLPPAMSPAPMAA